MSDSENDSIVFAELNVFKPVHRGQIVELLDFRGNRPRVKDIDFAAKVLHPAHNVYGMAVADVRAVLLERDSQLENFCFQDSDALFDHQLDDFRGDILAHAVVDAAAGEDDFRQITERLRLVGQVVRVDADAVSADQAGFELEEIPFCARSLQDVVGVDADEVEYLGEFVDERDIEVALSRT